MAKNLMNSISFSVLLLILLMASNGILKSESTCVLGECGLDPYTGTDADCCTCCTAKYTVSLLGES
ncbi:defensin-like protein 206 [Capsella rubella]|uniref:defensin-like protein 206 n=1 Tax=Capsella rubella TaxID=81985 RepID=UPI000CD58AF4|nr:defensin-like protein 206 [Capsella rubella]